MRLHCSNEVRCWVTKVTHTFPLQIPSSSPTKSNGTHYHLFSLFKSWDPLPPLFSLQIPPCLVFTLQIFSSTLIISKFLLQILRPTIKPTTFNFWCIFDLEHNE